MPKPTTRWILKDLISESHAQQLKASLYSYFNVHKPLGKHLPDGYHLIYFNPKHEEELLSKDGYDAHQQPADETFKRRLWASGEIKFVKPIKFQKTALCVESIERVRKVHNSQMVTINREVIVDGEICLEEKRSLVYTPDLYEPGFPISRPGKVADFTHTLRPTDLLLFRYSGLSFNSHKIHYNKEYAKSEGYPDILVQGPLTVTLLLEWVSTLFENVSVKNFKYKNQSPIFANNTITLGILKDSEKRWLVWIEGEDKNIHLSGTLNVE